jgi:glycosyltransferase involved in cell wall biosynthesis
VAPATEPADLAAIPAPRAVYVGALEYWFDAELLAKTARSLPDVSFVVIGPGSAEGGDLEHLPNVHLLGARPYDELPAYLQHCDIGIVPFRRDEMVDAIHPIKVYEYLAAGLPVVSTRWPELEHMGAPITMVEPDSFDAAVAGALRERPEDGRATRLAYAAANSWNERYGIVRDAVNAIITGEQDG